MGCIDEKVDPLDTYTIVHVSQGSNSTSIHPTNIDLNLNSEHCKKFQGRETICCIRVILVRKKLFLQLLHGFKLFHFVHRFQNIFCFRSTTFPSAVRTSDQQLLVLHCNYKEDFIPKFDLVITFGSYWHKVNASECKIFLVTPYLTIFGSPKYARQIPNLVVLGIIGVFGAHNLIGEGVLNMIEWVSLKRSNQMHFSHVDLVSKGPPSQSYDTIKFLWDIPEFQISS